MKKSPKDQSPPQWAKAFLEWFCPEDLYEGILGDLLEQYDDHQTLYNQRKTNRLFVWNVLMLFHPSIILRNKFHPVYFNWSLLKNHAKVASRNMKKYSFYSIVNILGLSLAITFTFLSFQFIRSELSYDKFHSNRDQIYRVFHRSLNRETGSVQSQSAITAIPLSKDLTEEIASIETFSRIASASVTLNVENNFFEEKVTYVDPGFFEIFDFPIVEGSGFSRNQNDVVILSQDQAQKLFGTTDCTGQLIGMRFSDKVKNFIVGGVVDNRKERSSIEFDLLLHIENFREMVGEENYHSYDVNLVENYILSNGTVRPEDLALTASSLMQKKVSDDQFITEIGLQPLNQLHLEDQIIGNAAYTNPGKLYTLAGIALLVMSIALINFIILSTSQSFQRSKEMGLRSVLGAWRSQLRKNMIAESLLLSAISSLLGLTIAYLILPLFSRLVDGHIRFQLGPKELLFILALCVFVALINGSLQALFLLRNNAIQSLNGQYAPGGKNNILNQTLLVIQFSISIILMIGALGMRFQISYVQKKDLGFDQERLLEININGMSNQESTLQLVERFRTQALQEPEIINVAGSMNNTREPWTQLHFEQPGGDDQSIFYNQVDSSYLSTMNIKLMQGQNFSPNRTADKSLIVNEALVRHFGWENPFDHQIPGSNFSNSHQIIGVVEDFHFSSMHQKIEPLILALDINSISSGITGLSTYVWPAGIYQLVVKVGKGDLKNIMQKIESIWKSVTVDKAFVYHFVDEALEANYAEDRRWAKVIGLATLFAIFIAWLGLFGLMRLSLRKRLKEIGIRRVLGASSSRILSLLTRQYIILVLLGNTIAIPTAFVLLRQWLNSYAYRIELRPSLFILTGLSVLLLAVCSLAMQSIKAISTNPSVSLKAQ